MFDIFVICYFLSYESYYTLYKVANKKSWSVYQTSNNDFPFITGSIYIFVYNRKKSDRYSD